MAEVVTIRSLLDGFRGRHDFMKETLLHLSHDVVIYCASEVVYGVPSLVILGYPWLSLVAFSDTRHRK